MTRDEKTASSSGGMPLRVLVVFGSKRGGTAGLARMIGNALTVAGCRAFLVPAGDARDLPGVDAVIVVGALYAGRWHPDARRFVRKHTKQLRKLPVWLVSSGPLDESAEKRSIPPTKQVLKLGRRIGARAHLTMGGRLSADASGFVAHSMAKKRAGDWRNAAHVKSFVAAVLRDLRSMGTGEESIAETVQSRSASPAVGSQAAHGPVPAAADR
jgi:menaquinone-dependent protoporphyrinogen oxidase